MITDDDVKKLCKVFATKDDLKEMEARQDKKYAVKDDLKALAKQDDLKALAKQDDLKRVEQKVGQMEHRLGSIEQKVASVDWKVDEVKSTLDNLTDAVGAIFLWTDDIHRAIVGKPMKRPHEN